MSIKNDHMMETDLLPPSKPSLVWRQPAWLWVPVALTLGLIVPVGAAWIMGLQVLALLLIPAFIATTIGFFKVSDLRAKSRWFIMLVFIGACAMVCAIIGVFTGENFLAAFVIGMIIGTPWALWVGFFTAFVALEKMPVSNSC